MSKTIFKRLFLNLHDMYDSVHPFHVFCRLFLLSNFKIVHQSNARRYQVCIWTVTIRLLTICTFISYILINLLNDFDRQSKLADLAAYWAYIAACFMSICCTLTETVLYKKLLSIWNGIKDIDFELARMGIKIAHWFVLLDLIFYLYIFLAL